MLSMVEQTNHVLKITNVYDIFLVLILDEIWVPGISSDN